MSVDEYYTPRWVCEGLVDAVPPSFEPEVLLDSAAGDGRLLEVASSRWPEARCIANDVDQGKSRGLRQSHPTWEVLNVDALGGCWTLKLQESLGSRRVLSILNPPFSVRGGTHSRSAMGEQVFRTSPALAFVLRSLAISSGETMVLTLLPRGTLESERDEAAWEWLRQHYEVSVVAELPRKAHSFARAALDIVALRIGPYGSGARPAQINHRRASTAEDSDCTVALVRGTVQIHAALARTAGELYPLVHTSHLRDGRLAVPLLVSRGASRTVTNEAILVPRVGTPRRDKVVRVHLEVPTALSDCLFAITPTGEDGRSGLDQAWEAIAGNWERLAAQYVGSCARYLTTRRLVNFLSDNGIGVAIVRSKSSPQ